MKQEKNIETKAESQNRQSIEDARVNQICTFNGVKSEYAMTQSPLSGEALAFTIGKAPPGRAHSPGAARGHPPENKAGPPGRTETNFVPALKGRPVTAKGVEPFGNQLHTEYQFFIHTNFNFLQTFNF